MPDIHSLLPVLIQENVSGGKLRKLLMEELFVRIPTIQTKIF
jgi:hypothetical protein